jgi:hypothetical protein
MGGFYYQAEATHVVDYQLYRLPGCGEYFRGPQMELKKNHYVAFVGAAQTFGAFCRHPFPSLTIERLGYACANLGIGGAGPETFLLDSSLLATINDARVAVVQIMSGRSAPNRLYENLKGTSSLRRRDAAPNGEWTWAETAWDTIIKDLPRDEVAELVEETRNNWITLMQELLAAITVPKVLLWISIRKPNYAFDLSSRKTALGPFPHLVNQRMLDEIIPHANAFVDATSHRGTPQPLFNRFTGELATISRKEGNVRYNHGYPSPEMHVDITEALMPVLKAWCAPKEFVHDTGDSYFPWPRISMNA